ncbi:phosphoribosylformylglycinamidine synthase subunit PurS [bacterium]|nr:phosphoribosylformylglycinamidine synthase subunit PurS [bacterium]
MRYRITVKFKEGVFNPEGDTVKRTLNKLGYTGVSNVSIERVFVLEVADDIGREQVEKLASDILSNPVIEDWEIERK